MFSVAPLRYESPAVFVCVSYDAYWPRSRDTSRTPTPSTIWTQTHIPYHHLPSLHYAAIFQKYVFHMFLLALNRFAAKVLGRAWVWRGALEHNLTRKNTLIRNTTQQHANQ